MTEARHISSLAMLDSIHDFKNIATSYYNILSESLPGSIDYIPTEPKAFEYVSKRSSNTLSVLSTIANDAFIQLGGTPRRPVAILCDASMCVKFLVDTLSKNTIGKVIVVRNREVKNDAGTNCNDTKLTNEGILIAKDISINNVMYPKYTVFSSINTKFGSIYSLELTHN